jgi:uncharacterized protein
VAATTDLVCPKCQGRMRSYERSGVTVDQCTDCRGIFLDRGELERLVDAGQGWQRSHPPPASGTTTSASATAGHASPTVPRHWAELSPAGGRPRTVLGRLVAWG